MKIKNIIKVFFMNRLVFYCHAAMLLLINVAEEL